MAIKKSTSAAKRKAAASAKAWDEKRPMPITKRRRKGATSAKVLENTYRYEDEPNQFFKKVSTRKKKVTRVRHKFKDGKGSSKN